MNENNNRAELEMLTFRSTWDISHSFSTLSFGCVPCSVQNPRRLYFWLWFFILVYEAQLEHKCIYDYRNKKTTVESKTWDRVYVILIELVQYFK